MNWERPTDSDRGIGRKEWKTRSEGERVGKKESRRQKMQRALERLGALLLAIHWWERKILWQEGHNVRGLPRSYGRLESTKFLTPWWMRERKEYISIEAGEKEIKPFTQYCASTTPYKYSGACRSKGNRQTVSALLTVLSGGGPTDTILILF